MPDQVSIELAVSSRPESGEQNEVLSALKRFTRSRPKLERCELCSAGLDSVHSHLLDRQSRQVVCACDACAILFSDQQDGKFARVPRRVWQLHDFAFTDLEWEQMMLPINMAFFLRNAQGGMTVMYPSPAGAIESQMGIENWDDLVHGQTVLQSMQPEVEALIVNRISQPAVYVVAPIDECYRLVGVIRTKWRGLSGGTDVWAAITEFFEELRKKADGAPEVRRG
jgi:hypothetical protein